MRGVKAAASHECSVSRNGVCVWVRMVLGAILVGWFVWFHALSCVWFQRMPCLLLGSTAPHCSKEICCGPEACAIRRSAEGIQDPDCLGRPDQLVLSFIRCLWVMSVACNSAVAAQWQVSLLM